MLRGSWSSIVSVVSRRIDLEATSRRFGALRRVRKVRTAEGLLRLALIWGPGRQSLREAAALAGEAGIADLSDKAVEGRLRKMGDWLEHILSSLLAERLGQSGPAMAGSLGLSLVDGTVICTPGQAEDWRVHARYDPDIGRFSDLVLTTARDAECASRTAVAPSRVTIMDRGYARARSLAAVLDGGGDFIVRTSWRALALYDRQGARLDVAALLRPHGELDSTARERRVWVRGLTRPLRLLIRPMPAEIAARQRLKRARKAVKKGHRMDPRTADAAGYLILLTSLPASTHSSAQVAACYRDRWQVEIGFKRLKTLGRLDELPSADPVLARTWLLAHLIAAVLTDDLANEIVGFPPKRPGKPFRPNVAMARLGQGTRDIVICHPAPTPPTHS